MTASRAASGVRNSYLSWIDGAKGIAIVLVVIGHEISGLIDAGVINSTAICWFFYDWIYSFHVPVFFFVAGLFVAKITT